MVNLSESRSGCGQDIASIPVAREPGYRDRQQQMIEAAFEELHLSVIESDNTGRVVAVSPHGYFTTVRPARLNRVQSAESGLLISVETGVKLDHLRKPGIANMLQSAGSLLADCATAIGGDAHGRILLHRVISSGNLSVDVLVAAIASTQHLRWLFEAPSDRSEFLI
jgi:hypothetical protein